MSTVGFRTWHRKISDTVFIVKNIASEGKRIRIFQYPIRNGYERDLLAIPYVSEADIRHSLLKGELLTKFLANEITVTRSNIDLLQFDNTQKSFLESMGILNGLDVSSVSFPFLFKQGLSLIGTQDGVNRIFTTPNKFINGSISNNIFRISIRHNGRELVEGNDFITSESGGAGTGYDTVIFTNTLPDAESVVVVDYVIGV